MTYGPQYASDHHHTLPESGWGIAWGILWRLVVGAALIGFLGRSVHNEKVYCEVTTRYALAIETQWHSINGCEFLSDGVWVDLEDFVP